MNAIELLKKQHKEVKALLERIEESDEDSEKQRLFNAIADNLAAHSEIEEKIFYPAAYAKRTDVLLHEAVEEHLAIKRLIADLLEMKPSAENFDAKVTVLREQVEHHVKEEEQDLFPKISKDLPNDELEALGEDMEELFDQEIGKKPRNKVPEQTHEAAPLT